VPDTRIATTSSTTVSSEQNQDERVTPAGLREYQSVDYHFSLLYPEELSIAEYSEGGGATTVTFQNVQKVIFRYL
jgi:hypothetical protein